MDHFILSKNNHIVSYLSKCNILVLFMFSSSLSSRSFKNNEKVQQQSTKAELLHGLFATFTDSTFHLSLSASIFDQMASSKVPVSLSFALSTLWHPHIAFILKKRCVEKLIGFRGNHNSLAKKNAASTCFKQNLGCRNLM